MTKHPLFEPVERVLDLDSGLRVQLAIGRYGDVLAQVLKPVESYPQAGRAWAKCGSFEGDSLEDAQLVLDTLVREVSGVLGEHTAARSKLKAEVESAALASL